VPMPDVWRTRTKYDSPETVRLFDAYLEAGGLILVCGEWYELYDVRADVDAEGVALEWHWTLVRRGPAGDA
jgi:hypothetical protein